MCIKYVKDDFPSHACSVHPSIDAWSVQLDKPNYLVSAYLVPATVEWHRQATQTPSPVLAVWPEEQHANSLAKLVRLVVLSQRNLPQIVFEER